MPPQHSSDVEIRIFFTLLHLFLIFTNARPCVSQISKKSPFTPVLNAEKKKTPDGVINREKAAVRSDEKVEMKEKFSGTKQDKHGPSMQ